MGKKAKKSLSKPKKKENPELNNQEQVNDQIRCFCCLDAIKEGYRHALTCQKCGKCFHKVCVDPKNQNKQLICDQCRLKPNAIECAICKDESQHFLLKYDGTHYYHYSCCLYSPSWQFDSFLNLKIQNKRNSSSRSSFTQKCKYCGIQGTKNGVLSCQLCNLTAHILCAQYFKQFYPITFTTNYLNLNEKQNYLLDYIIRKKSIIKELLPNHLDKSINRQNILVCDTHDSNNKQFCWCICGNASLNSGDENLYPCEQCSRCIHKQCAQDLKGLSKAQIQKKKYYCIGCKNKPKDIFIRQMKAYELIEEIIKIEKSQRNLNDKTIRFLNAFPFNYSAQIEKKISENQREVEHYFLKKQLQNFFERDEENDMQVQLDEESENAARLIVMFLLNGERKEVNRKKLSSPDEITNILEEIEAKKQQSLFSDSKILKKIRQLFSKLLSSFLNNHDHIFTVLKEKLAKLILVCSSNNEKRSESSFEEIAGLLFEISEIIYQIGHSSPAKEQNQKFLNAFQQKFKDTFFWVLLDKRTSKEEMKQVLQKYSSIKFLLEKKRDVKEEHYWEFKEKYFNEQKENNKMLDENAENQRTSTFLHESFKKLRVKSAAVIKQERLQEIRQSFITQPKNFQQIDKLRYDAIDEGIALFGNDSQFEVFDAREMQKNILKKRYLALCNKKQQNLEEKDLKFIPKLMDYIREFGITLTKQEIDKFQKLRVKLNFMLFLIKNGEPFLQALRNQMYECEDSNQDNSVVNENTNQMSLVDKVKFVLRGWSDTVLPHYLMIRQIKQLLAYSVVFKDAEINEQINATLDKLCSLMEKFKRDGKKMKGNIIRDLVIIIRSLKKQEQYESLLKDHNSYEQWININPTRKSIPLILESPQQTQNLSKIIDHRLNQVQNLTFFDLSEQTRKMNVLKVWCQISEKIFASTQAFGSKKRPTINAIQNMRNYCQKVEYPKNRVLEEINNLYTKGIELNKQIAKFLEKPKYSDFMETYDELQTMKQKLKYEEGIEMKKHFEKSSLDIGAEIQQLQQEIKEFNSLPNSLQLYINSTDLAEIKKMRVRCLDSAFQYHDIGEYHKLILRMYELKCQNFSGPITRKQYFQLINSGGASALQLLQKTASLNKVYRQIQRAEQEVATNYNSSRRNYANLIPWDDKKFKQIREQLKIDPTELAYFQKAKQHCNKIRDNYIKMRNGVTHVGFSQIFSRIDYKKLSEIQLQLFSSIFNNKELLNDISTLKTGHNELISKFQKQYINQFHQNHNYKRIDIMYLQKCFLQSYKKLNIRNDLLDILELDCKSFREMRENSKTLFLENNVYCKNYVQFNLLAKNLSKNFSGLTEVMDLRERSFLQVYQKIIGINQPLFEIWDALIDQGAGLKILNSKYQEDIFNKVFEIHVKIRQAKKQWKNRDNDDDVGEGSEQNYDDEQDDEDDQDLSGIDDFGDFDDDDEDSEDDESEDDNENPNKGRKMQANQIILDDDD